MYEKQVKLLRYCAEADCTECAVAGCPGPRELLKKAADAIEELSKRVPPVPHGRLIDADAFTADLCFPSEQFKRGFCEMVADAPTIIPAEE